MSFGNCEVIGCGSLAFNGWWLKNKTKVFLVCKDHLRRHKDRKNDFNLRQAFRLDAFTETAEKPSIKTQHQAMIARSCRGCGENRLSGHVYCSACALERKKHLNRIRQKEHYRRVAECAKT